MKTYTNRLIVIAILLLAVLILIEIGILNKHGGFVDALEGSGIEKLPFATGASWTDFNNDGYIDLFIGGRQTRLYQGSGNGTFTDVTKQADIEGASMAGVFGDFDNDGCKDFFMVSLGQQTDRLYRNNCNGTFTNVTNRAGLKSESYVGAGAAWADYDNDGFLDLYIANHGIPLNPKIPVGLEDHGLFNERIVQPNILYRNNGNGIFTDVTIKAGVSGATGCSSDFNKLIGDKLPKDWPFKESFQPIWFDYDNDNWIDLFIATDGGISPLYQNNGDGTFTEVTKKAGLCRMGTGMGVTVGDFDNDGDMDLYITNVGANYLWRNSGDGTFTETAAETGTSDHQSIGWGTGFFDFDNDGYLDLYVINGTARGLEDDPDVGRLKLDKLYKNNGDRTFSEVSLTENIKGDYAKEAMAFADYNSDGFVDMFVATRYLSADGTYRLYKNKGNTNRWLTLELIGTTSNRDSVGAKITLKTGGKTQKRQITSGSSYISQDSLLQTFGLGKTDIADEIIIRWPSGIEKVLHKVKVNQKIIVTEK